MQKSVLSFVIIITLCLNVSLFGAENREISLEEEVNSELAKIVVTADDRMELKILSEEYPVNSYYTSPKRYFIVFKNLTIPFNPFPGETYLTDESDIFRKLFKSIGNNKAIAKLLEYYNHLKPYYTEPGFEPPQLSIEERKKIQNELIKAFYSAIIIFNQTILSDNTARANITTVYRELYRDRMTEIVNERRIERSHVRNAFIYFLFGAGTSVQIPTSHHYGVEFSYGIRFNYFFLHPVRKNNYGILTNLSFIQIGGEGQNASSMVSTGYLNIDFLFALKFSFYNNVSNLLLAAGVSASIKTGGNYTYTNYYGDICRFEFPKFIPSIAIEIGYLLISKNQSFSLFFTLFAKIGFTSSVTTYKNEIKQQDENKYWSAGIRFGLGFNLH